MASSRKHSNRKTAAPDLARHVAGELRRVVRPGDRLVVALSGGVDSMVLLDLLHRLRVRGRYRLAAVHINHQLSPHAARWAAFCRRICRKLDVPIRVARVTIARGDSLEAAARAARYAVFRRLPCDYVLLAHHRDDQVETLFLQLLRGAGVKGLAAMPFLRDEGGGRRVAGKRLGAQRTDASTLDTRHSCPAILRPLLDATRGEILDYAQQRGIEWVEDESNADVRFQRNFLRREVLPAIALRFPAYRATVARSARHFAESAGLLDELALCDGAAALHAGTLAVDGLRRLSAARARNLLRYLLSRHDADMPNAGRLDEALRQALNAARDAQVAIDLGAFELRRFEGRLHVVARGPEPRADLVRRWRGEPAIRIPELGGVLVMARARGTGLSLARLLERPVAVRVRRGGERLQPDRRRPRRTLKNLMQEARIPPWERERLPLVFCGSDLAWAPVIGADCSYQAGPGEPSIAPSWRPAAERGITTPT